MSDRKTSIRVAIESGNVNLARELLKSALSDNPDADIYYLASQVALTEDQKKRFVTKLHTLDPDYAPSHLFIHSISPHKEFSAYLHNRVSPEAVYTELKAVEAKIPITQARLQQLKLRQNMSRLAAVFFGGAGFVLIIVAFFTSEVFTILGLMAMLGGSAVSFILMPREKIHLLEAELEIANRKRSEYLEQLGI